MSKRRYECKGKLRHEDDGFSDFDCGYPHAGDIGDCTDCIICGGLMSPQTGKPFRGNHDLYPVPESLQKWSD